MLSVVNLAKRVGISRIAIWKMHKRHPRLRAWVNQQLSDAAREQGGAVLMKMASVGLKGSEPHARLFFTVTGQVGPVKVTPGGGDDRQPTRVIYEYPAGTPAPAVP